MADDHELYLKAEAVTAAWTAMDYPVLREIVDENVVVVHQNRGLTGKGIDRMIATIEEMAKAFPDRTLGPTKRWAVSGDTVFRETVWQGTAQVDVPGFGLAGEHCSLNVCSLMTFRDGRLVEWCDYG